MPSVGPFHLDLVAARLNDFLRQTFGVRVDQFMPVGHLHQPEEVERLASVGQTEAFGLRYLG